MGSGIWELLGSSDRPPAALAMEGSRVSLLMWVRAGDCRTSRLSVGPRCLPVTPLHSSPPHCRCAGVCPRLAPGIMCPCIGSVADDVDRASRDVFCPDPPTYGVVCVSLCAARDVWLSYAPSEAGRTECDKSGSELPPPLSGKSNRLLAVLETAASLGGGVRRYLATNPGRGH